MINRRYQLEDLLLLGDPRSYQFCEDVRPEELAQVTDWVDNLHHVMEEIRGSLSELIQHEYDHLEGVLCIDHAIDNRSF